MDYTRCARGYLTQAERDEHRSDHRSAALAAFEAALDKIAAGEGPSAEMQIMEREIIQWYGCESVRRDQLV